MRSWQHNKGLLSKAVFASISILALNSTVRATLLVSDDFVNFTSGTGWSNPSWTGNNFWQYQIGPNLTYPGLSNLGGSAVSNQQAFRDFTPDSSTGFLYVSYLLKDNGNNGSNFTDVTLFSSGNEVVGSGVTWTGGSQSTTYSTWGNWNGSYATGGTVADGKTHLFVEKVNLTSGQTDVFLDPSLTAGALPETPSWSVNLGGALPSINQVRLELSGTWADAIRIGTQESDIIAPIGTNSWAVNTSGDWNNNANWSSGSAPHLAGAVVALGNTITSSKTLLINSDTTIGSLAIDSTHSYFVQGYGNLYLDNGSSTATITVASGDHAVVPGGLYFSGNTTVAVAAGSNLALGGTVTGTVVADGVTITKSGTGNLTFVGNLVLGTGSVISLEVAPSAALASAVITDGISGNGVLNLANNKAVIHNASVGDVEAQVAAGQITSNLLGANTVAIGVLSGAQYIALHGNSATFAGQSVATSDVLLSFTYAGDINLDGEVTAAELANIKLGASGWINGDFNHDGTVDYTDVALADAAYTLEAGAGANAIVAADVAKFGSAFVLAYDTALAGGAPGVVPEPASLGLLGLGAMLLLKRKK